MKLGMSLATVAALLVTQSASAQFLPKNNLHLFDSMNFTANINEAQFNAITDSVIKMWEGMATIHGAKLESEKLWSDPTVNAMASRDLTEKNWKVHMYGGLARRTEMTPDGFAGVVCHEVGHHFGGFPFKGSRWAATEGQSDYFATQYCLRALWKDELAENAKHATTVNAVAKKACDASWAKETDRNLCYRTANASQSLANLLAALGGTGVPDFGKPSIAAVTVTNENHPEAQCRLDTYFMGALCKAEFDPKVIPARSHAQGQGSAAAEQEASKYSCMKFSGHKEHFRPRCWFKPKTDGLDGEGEG